MKNSKSEISGYNFHDAKLESVSWQNDEFQNSSGEIQLLIGVGENYELLTIKFDFLTEFVVYNIKGQLTPFVLDAEFDVGLKSMLDESGELNGLVQECFSESVENYLSIRLQMDHFSGDPKPFNQAYIQMTGVNVEITMEK